MKAHAFLSIQPPLRCSNNPESLHIFPVLHATNRRSETCMSFKFALQTSLTSTPYST